MPPSRWRPFPFRPVHAWLVWCPPACVWSVYGHVAAAAAVWLVRGCRGRLMVGWVCVGFVALLLVVLSSNPACVAGTSVSVLVSCVLVFPNVVYCSLLTLVCRVRSGRVTVFRCVFGHGGWRVWLTTVSPARWTQFSYRPMHVWPVWCWPACVRSVHGNVVAAVVVLLPCGRVSRLLVSLFSVGSLLLQRALAHSDLLRAGVLLVAVLVGASCVGVARYVSTARRLPSVGEKSNDKWLDRCNIFFRIRWRFPCPALAVLHAQPIIWYLAVLCGRSSCFACAIHMYGPRRWQGPVGPPWCVPVLPMGAPGCCSGSVVRSSCSFLPACRAPYRAVFCGSCGWRACVAVLSLVVRMVRAARFVLWCRDALSDVVGWARRNTLVPAGRGSAWPHVASLWSPVCPGWGFGG